VITGLLAGMAFLIWAVPQWLNSVWGLFQSETFGQWLVKQKFSSSNRVLPVFDYGAAEGGDGPQPTETRQTA
jgi:hypothetical protein